MGQKARELIAEWSPMGYVRIGDQRVRAMTWDRAVKEARYRGASRIVDIFCRWEVRFDGN